MSRLTEATLADVGAGRGRSAGHPSVVPARATDEAVTTMSLRRRPASSIGSVIGLADDGVDVGHLGADARGLSTLTV